ncbi:hypothetical protein EB796_024893 [Bugula neritina]|uniref:RUN domain-containing protein n=1 Tax=Bugula neritina TaxID=10212 RepID=A0A7J7IU85_BUGNE|nr:hypothetical protein EB796_024893 [Bugula neritina]
MDEKSDSLVTDDLSDKSPVFNVTSSRLQMFVDSDWPQPMICNAETEKADKKAKRRIKKNSEEIARDNLVTIFKLVSKELMDSSLVHGRLLDDEFVPLQQLFTVLEHIFLNGLKVKKLSQIKSMLGGNKDFYSILEQVQKTCTEAAELSNTVKEASNIKLVENITLDMKRSLERQERGSV